jgi:hypothetical protein
MRKPRKLTPSQERRLHTALTLDNLLYREFQRLRADLDRDVERLYRMPSRVVEVAAKHGQLLMPLKTIKTPEAGAVSARAAILAILTASLGAAAKSRACRTSGRTSLPKTWI